MASLVPTRTLVLLALVPLVLSLLSLWQRSLVLSALGIDVVLLAVAAVDARRGSGPAPTVVRRVQRVWSVGRPTRVEIEVRNDTGRHTELELEQTLFPGAEAPALPLRLSIPSQGVAKVAVPAVPRLRGHYELGDHHLRVRSPWGLWQDQLTVAASDPVHVYPDVRALTSYDLLARSNRQGLLTHAVRRPGGEAEFDRLRQWQRGDEYRHVDWKATARSRGPIVRQLRQETDRNVMFLLDCGRMMTAETECRSALDYALDATLMVSHVALRKGDRVGLLGFDSQVRAFLPPSGGRRAGQSLIRTASNLFPALEEPDYEAAFAVLRMRVRRRSLVVLFTHFIDDVNASLVTHLVGRVSGPHLPVCVLLRDPGVEALLMHPADGRAQTPWIRGAAAEIVCWRDRAVRRLREQGALVLDVTPQQFTGELLARYLEVKARKLL